MNLIIVESPTKAKTISRLFGQNFLVAASYGHIRDLPQKELGVEIEKDFKPKYVIPPKAKPRIEELKKYLEKAGEVILATDEDREGEAIAFHLKEVLNLKNPKRIVFHEITKPALLEAFKKPRQIKMDLVYAQQARRILDRLVGYKLSPLLWKKVVRGLSAGRVQSVTVRLIVEREKEIENFQPQEYWTITAWLREIKSPQNKEEILFSNLDNLKIEELSKTHPEIFSALLVKKNGKPLPKLAFQNREEAEKIINELKTADYSVNKVEKKKIKKSPPPPFTTSTLQQELWQKLKMPAKTTMALAQKLYEQGLITYHRTDSLHLSPLSQAAAKKFIEQNFGQEYWPGFHRCFKSKSKTAQEAHEAIRPTYPEQTPKSLKIESRLLKVYEIIWQRFIASQMSEAIFNSVDVEIKAGNYLFKASGQTLEFDGFTKLYPFKHEENQLPELVVKENLNLIKLMPAQHFTQPPARFSEASLIKKLEAEGIGRPSTYASILDTIQKRGYVMKNSQKQFQPTEMGIIVNDLLVKHFPKIVDLKFTAKMEEDLDKIALGKKNWIETLKEFYVPFQETLEKKQKEIKKKELAEKTEKTCPLCHAPLVRRVGKFGRFYACSNFPKCKYTASLEKPKLGIKCPQCGQGEIEEKRTKKGKIFYGCSRFPHCRCAFWEKPLNKRCPQCGSLLVEKNGKEFCPNKNCKAKI